MYNPDYPSSASSFAQYTYQPTAQADMYYYAGGNNAMFSGGPFNDPYAYGQPDCRRNFGGMPMNPVNPFQQFGQPNAQMSVPEDQIQPFSSYPPSAPTQTPNGNAAPMGLNSLIDSRRNITQNTSTASMSPWAQQKQNTMQAPVQVPQTIPTVPQNTNGWFNNGYNMGYNVDMNMQSLYGNTSFGFDRHDTWDNYYTKERQLPPPNINWGAINEAHAPYNNRPVQPQIPANQCPVPSVNWRESAEKIWNQNL